MKSIGSGSKSVRSNVIDPTKEKKDVFWTVRHGSEEALDPDGTPGLAS
jgi:hypothetical protein